MICLDVRVERSQGFFLISMSRPTQLVEQQADLVRCVVVCPSHFLELMRSFLLNVVRNATVTRSVTFICGISSSVVLLKQLNRTIATHPRSHQLGMKSPEYIFRAVF
jgi:hypothetical protein